MIFHTRIELHRRLRGRWRLRRRVMKGTVYGQISTVAPAMSVPRPAVTFQNRRDT
jgi:hypothetical protein